MAAQLHQFICIILTKSSPNSHYICSYVSGQLSATLVQSEIFLTNIKWITLKFGTEIHGPNRVSYNKFFPPDFTV